MDGDYLILLYSILVCVVVALHGIMYKIHASTATNKSYIVQTLSVGVATYYCMYNIVLLADYCARWLGITYHVEFTVISNRQATFKFNA